MSSILFFLGILVAVAGLESVAVMYEGTKVAERNIHETDLEDLVHLIVGEHANSSAEQE